MSGLPSSRDESKVHLRVFQDEDQPPQSNTSLPPAISPHMTLSEFYESVFVLLWVEGRTLKLSTRKSYGESVEYWRQLTGDPPLLQIDDFTVAQFVKGMCEQPGRNEPLMASITVARHCRHIQKILEFAGPKGREKRSRRNQNLIPDPPFVEGPPPEKKPPSGDYSLPEIHSMYWACDRMNRPNKFAKVAPTDFWRALIVVAYYTGLRKSQLLSLRHEDIERPWHNGGRIKVSESKGRRKKVTWHYLPAEALAHIDQLGYRPWIFPWWNWPKAFRPLNDHFTKLMRFAKIDAAKYFGTKFHGFRKAHDTLLAGLDLYEGARIAQESSNHEDLKTTMESYINQDTTDFVVARAIDRLPSPVPTEFEPGHQLRLF